MNTETYEYKDFTIEVVPDVDPENPREWDNLGTMACSHDKYKLGDKEIDMPVEHYLLDLLISVSPIYDTPKWENWDYNPSAYSSNIWTEFSRFYLWLPLYIYDHSGLSMQTTEYTCPWDSGQVGIIYVSKADALKAYKRKRSSNAFEQRIYNVLRSEVQTYSYWLEGAVYGYNIWRDGDVVGSCNGYYGYNVEKSGLLPDARDEIDSWRSKA